MFLGQYEHTIDEKGRVIIPVRYRALLQEGAYITQGFERNLMILPAASFEHVSAELNAMSLTDPNARQLRRLIFSKADKLEVDKAGRALIPPYLREILSGNTVIVAGAGAYIEIFTQEEWAKHNEQLNDSDATAQGFVALNLSTQ